MYFALTKGYVLKIYNLNFHETFSIESDVNALIHMVFNTLTNELITASRSEIYIWTFGQFVKQSVTLAKNFGLVLKLKWQVDGGRLINRITLDEEAQRLYCLSETSVWCYNLHGKLLFIVKRACSTHLSACAVSSNTVIAGSVDGQVSFLTTSGGKIHTFFSHSNLITEILIHPCDSQLIITASLDGYIKLFSLDLVEELYSVKVFEDGIEYMSLKSSDVLYCVSTKEIEEFDLNYWCQFWGQLRYPAHSIEIIESGEKSSRVMVLDCDSSIKLFSARDKRKLCTVLPPPTVELSKKVLPCVHDIEYNLIYILVTSSEVWVYTTKTDPACFLATINLLEDNKKERTSRVVSPTVSDAPIVFTSVQPKCLCIEILPDFFKVEFVDGDGVAQTKCNLLACGMDNGQILLFNPIMKGRKENSLQICRDPIVQLKFCKEILSIVAITKAKVGLRIRIINSNLENCVLITCDDDITTSAIKGATLALGFGSGHIIVQEQLLQQQKVIQLSKQSSVDHSHGVLSISFHQTLDILCSAGRDCCVKIWSIDRHLLCEITLDSSLTSVCFLNSSGDMLIGFKGNLFVIRNGGKYKWLEDTVDEIDRPLSHIYENPGLRYETKHPLSPDLETMEKYLVPYNDMIFMTHGTWIVKNDDAPSMKSDFDEASFGDGSDEDSVAPSDIYQSSVFSLGSSGTMQWALPDCGLTPEGSVADESEEEDNTQLDENEAEKKTPMKGSGGVVSKTRLDKLLVQEDKSEDSIALYMPEFAHSSSERLITTKIDIKKSTITKGPKQGKGGKGVSGAVQSHVLSKENKAIKESVVKEDKHRAVKKTRKPATERKRATSKIPTAKTSYPDHGGEMGVPMEEGKLDLSQGVDADKEAAILTQDGTEEGSLSGTDHLQDPETPELEQPRPDQPELEQPELEQPEPEQQGTVLAKDVIHLRKGTVLAKGVICLKKGAAQIAEDGEIDNSRQIVAQPGTEDQSSLQQGSESIGLDENETEEHLDGINAMNDGQVSDLPIIASPLLYSDLSSVTSQYSKYSEAESGSVMDHDVGDMDGDTSLDKRVHTLRKAANARTVKTNSQGDASASLLSILKQKPKSPKRSKDLLNVKVVPSYSQEAVHSDSTIQGSESSHDSKADIAVKSERMKVHDTKGVYMLQKRKKFEWKNEKTHDKKPIFQRRSQAIRIPFGETLDKQQALSSSTVVFTKSKISVEPDVLSKVGKDPDEVLKLCTSAFKKQLKKQGTLPSTIFSAGTSESRTKGEARLRTSEVNEEELRPRTALTLQQRKSTTEKTRESSTESKGTTRKTLVLSKSKGNLKSDMNRVNDNDSISVGGDEYIVNAAMGYSRKEMEPFNQQQCTDSIQQEEHHVTRIQTKRDTMGYSRKEMEPFNQQQCTDSIQQEEHHVTWIQTKRGDDRVQQDGFTENVNMHNEAADGTNERPNPSIINKRSIMYKGPMKGPTKGGPESSYVNGTMQKTYDERVKRKGSLTVMTNKETTNALNTKQQYDELSKDGTINSSIKMEKSETYFSPKIGFARANPKGKVFFVDIPDNVMTSGKTAANDSDFERFSPEYGLRYEKHKHIDRATIVPSPEEKLLKHRAASADMKRRQDNARFRRKAIEQQRRARAQNRSASPTYTQDYLLDYLSDPDEDIAPNTIYEYNKPTPLYHDGKLIKSEEMKGVILTS